MGNEHQWDGVDRRDSWNQHEKLVLNHITESKIEINNIKNDLNNIKITLAEFRIELKQIVSSSASRTSGIISVAVSVVSGLIMYFLIGKA